MTASGDIFSYSFTKTVDADTQITFWIYMNDSAGNWNSTGPHTFTVINIVISPPLPGGGYVPPPSIVQPLPEEEKRIPEKIKFIKNISNLKFGIINITVNLSIIDVAIEIDEKNKAILPGQNVSFFVKIYAINNYQILPVLVRYTIEDSKDNIVYEENETLLITNQLFYKKDIAVPKSLGKGTYKIKVFVNSDKGKSSTSENLKIISWQEIIIPYVIIVLLIITVIVAVILLGRMF